MGRPSKLTEVQWEQLGKRLLAGEKTSDLAREYGVSKTRISERFSARFGTVKSVANQIVATKQALAGLPVSEQVIAFSLADELIAVSSHLASAAKYGAASAHRLNGIAHAKVQEIDDAAPLDDESLKSLKGVAVLTRMANDAASIGINLLSANKDRIREAELNAQTEAIPSGLDDFYALPAR